MDLSRANRTNNSKELAHLHTEGYVLQCRNIQTLCVSGEELVTDQVGVCGYIQMS